MARITRRNFIRTTAAASAAFPLFTIAGTKASGRVLGANDTIRIGVAGIRGRGQSHIDAFSRELKDQNVQVTYLIDPDTRLFADRKSRVTANGGNDPRTVKDIAKRSTTRISTQSPWQRAITGIR